MCNGLNVFQLSRTRNLIPSVTLVRGKSDEVVEPWRLMGQYHHLRSGLRECVLSERICLPTSLEISALPFSATVWHSKNAPRNAGLTVWVFQYTNWNWGCSLVITHWPRPRPWRDLMSSITKEEIINNRNLYCSYLWSLGIPRLKGCTW